MGRKIRRVPLDFDWPLNERWSGFLRPDHLKGDLCPTCIGDGYSPRGRELDNLWYGNAHFQPEDNGCVPLTPHTPAVWEFAQRNVARSPGFYGGADSKAILREATRLANLWNGMWCHHLNAQDVAALVEAGRLLDFTHRWDPEQRRWCRIEPPVMPTPEQVNLWSINGFGHDAINSGIVIRARCEREGVPVLCATCQGEGSLEAYPGQRDEAEAWERTEPPTGAGWQLWETVTEGSPISPVFSSAEELARWLTTPEGAEANNQAKPMTYETALAFVHEGWAPTFITNPGGAHRGDEFIGTAAVIEGAVGDLDE